MDSRTAWDCRETPGAALKTALTAPTTAVDIGMMGHRHFLNVAGVGFDAAVAIRYDKRPTRGTATYAVESLSRRLVVPLRELCRSAQETRRSTGRCSSWRLRTAASTAAAS